MKFLTFTGMSRSGNHGVIRWLVAHYEEAGYGVYFYNNTVPLFLEHVNFIMPHVDRSVKKAFIVSFEDVQINQRFSKLTASADHNILLNVISEEQVRDCFGDRLKSLERLSFKQTKRAFAYDPVCSLLSAEPHVMEKYRSKFYSLKRASVPQGYDAYFHVRFDLLVDHEVSKAILAVLESYDSSLGTVHMNRHIFGRKGLFGDIFQVMDHETLIFMQAFYDRLFDPDYLGLDIPKVPERVLMHYFRKEAPGKKLAEIPCRVKLNRSRS